MPKRIEAYFSHLTSTIFNDRKVHSLAVAHMVPNTLSFAPALNDLTTLSAVLAKPKSVDRPEFTKIRREFPTPKLSREWASDADAVVQTLYDLNLKNEKVLIVDIGGYFSDSIDDVTEKFEGQIVGLLEGTENGVQRYEGREEPYKTPLITTARSPLKLPEDHLVASSLVFSIEAVLREQAEILQTRRAAVIGYGRVGSSVAELLRGRGLNTVIFDTDPIALARAAARGLRAYKKRKDALARANLVVCATGNTALDLAGFAELRPGTVVASVTSADDEFDLPSLQCGYTMCHISDNLVKYEESRESGRFFTMVAGGNAANFLHGAVIGPAIQLIEGEKLKAVGELIKGEVRTGLMNDIPKPHAVMAELKSEDRTKVAEIWNEHFL